MSEISEPQVPSVGLSSYGGDCVLKYVRLDGGLFSLPLLLLWPCSNFIIPQLAEQLSAPYLSKRDNRYARFSFCSTSTIGPQRSTK